MHSHQLLLSAVVALWCLPFPVLGNAEIKTVHRFPSGTWVENLAVRRNGHVLVTLMSTPQLWQIDPSNRTAPETVHQFPDATGLSGIAELEPDTFAVLVGNFSLGSFTVHPDSFYLWTLHFNDKGDVKITGQHPLFNMSIPNGMTTLSAENGTVLVADCYKGIVWRLDSRTGAYEIALDDESLQPVYSAGTPGVDGIRYVAPYLYYDNPNKSLFGRVAIDPNTGKPTGPYEVISSDIAVDDFCPFTETSFLVALNGQSTISRLFVNGTQEAIAGSQNSSLVAGPTSVARGRADFANLYFITTHEQTVYSNGTSSGGGGLLSLSL